MTWQRFHVSHTTISRSLVALAILGLVAPLTPCFAEEPGTKPTTIVLMPPPPAKPYGMGQLGYDARYLARRARHPTQRDKQTLLVIAGTTVALYLLRDEIRDQFQDHRSEGRSDWYESGRNIMGKGAFAPGLALVSYGASFATRNPREKETTQLLLESAALSAATAYLGSFILAAERPEQGDSITFFDTDGRGVSLDAALAASVIPPLRRQYLRVRPGDGRGKKIWKRTATTLLYGGAVLTAFQRMDQDKHWAPDVFLGIASGLGAGHLLNQAHDRAAADRLSWRLGGAPDGQGVVATFTISLD